MRHQFSAEQWVPYRRERVFAFFADPANLPPLMPAWQRTRVEHMVLVPPSASSGMAGKGSQITISFRPVPLVPFRLFWEAYIDDFCWQESFCDTQRRGPFRYFRHCHRIHAWMRDGVDGCVVSDAVEYELPFGWLGDVAHAVGVKRQIRSLFAHRQRMLLELLAHH